MKIKKGIIKKAIDLLNTLNIKFKVEDRYK